MAKCCLRAGHLQSIEFFSLAESTLIAIWLAFLLILRRGELPFHRKIIAAHSEVIIRAEWALTRMSMDRWPKKSIDPRAGDHGHRKAFESVQVLAADSRMFPGCFPAASTPFPPTYADI